MYNYPLMFVILNEIDGFVCYNNNYLKYLGKIDEEEN
jgi:hypothetical protein